jgi:DNA-binding NarL/FixJ family response regulator
MVMIKSYMDNYRTLSGDHHEPSIRIVGTNHLQYELITFCLVNELNARCAFNSDLASIDLSDATVDLPQLLLFDCQNQDIADLEKSFGLFASALPVRIRVALFNVAPKVKLIRFIRQHKIRGVFYKDDSRHLFIKGIRTILEGSLWLSRKVLSDCVRMPGNKYDPQTMSLKKLSNREKEILKSVAAGGSNQEIANQLCISVHTVKTHLYKIYRKIDVPNRMRATLWLGAARK